MTRASPWVCCAALCLAAVLGPAVAAGQELPPEVQVDLYLVRAERHIQNQNWPAALEALDIVLLLQADGGMETPSELWFTHARAALEAGFPDAAITSATRYLQEAGRQGESYQAALVLLDQAMSRAEGEPAPAVARAQPPGPATVPAPARAATPAPAATPPAATPPPPAAPEPAVQPAEGAGGLTVLFPLVAMNASTMAFGGQAGIGASQIIGVGGGFGVAFPVSGRYGVQIGAQFAQKGARMTLRGGDVAASADVTFENLDLTALARISALTVANLPIYALVGPYASFELGCRFVADASAGAGGFAPSGDCRNANLDTQSIDFGVSGGLGIEMGTGETRITGGLLYSYGIQDIDKYVGQSARHRVLNIHAGVARTF
ncbi:MAG: PorT family protein [Gammaproteobacteria bacterium]|nr:PorT family protein [Gammaproteobacteria bacterium]